MKQDIEFNNVVSLLMLPKKYVSNEVMVSSGKMKQSIKIDNNEGELDEVIVPNFVRLSPRKNEVYDADSDDTKTESVSSEVSSENGSTNSNMNDQCWSSADKENVNHIIISNNQSTRNIVIIDRLSLSKKYSSKDDNFKVLKTVISCEHLNDISNEDDHASSAPPQFIRRDPPKRI